MGYGLAQINLASQGLKMGPSSEMESESILLD